MRLRTIFESISISSVDHSECPDKCEYCNSPGDLRPYGKGGAWICAKCGMKPENIEEVEKNFARVLDGEKLKGIDVVTIDEAKEKVRKVAIDFDGTIHSYINGFQEGRYDPPVS